jgi:hypothetical protein
LDSHAIGAPQPISTFRADSAERLKNVQLIDFIEFLFKKRRLVGPRLEPSVRNYLRMGIQ